ncbi:hypothetical protein [Homoserinimonas hongtaonis]|uniref:Cell division protein FtsL n=1 Tax=Homoserinimonas hongtaonis TaxID=2079791 RepID=A0A2U1SY52_9MICO|nr:hypothetical protein [Salinibacterium hongtaonis]PWB96560.1 hypothetical protein DF220_00930 [Salinibacterium hongtaonis]
MSDNLARVLPAPLPREPRRAPHIEIAPSRQQRRARPKLAYAIVIVAGLFAVLVSQLLLSIALADGAYEIAALQAEQKELNRDEQIATEALDVLNSPQNLAARAESLGMVSNDSAVYLDLASGAVKGVPQAARGDAGSVIGANGGLLIPNSLLQTVPDMGAAAGIAAAEAESADDAGASGLVGADASVPSYPNGLPAPITR